MKNESSCDNFYFFSHFYLLQSTDIEFRHELMNRLNKLDTDVELEILPGQQQQQQQQQQHNASISPSSSAVVYGGSYENYGPSKEYYCGGKNELIHNN
jgi:hypothetical protein